MSDTILIRHPELDAVVEIPADGLGQYRQGGWVPLTDDEVAAREQAYLDERAALDDAMRNGPTADEAGPVSEERAAEDEAMATAAAEATAAQEQALADERAAAEAPAPEPEPEAAPRKSRRSMSEETQ